MSKTIKLNIKQVFDLAFQNQNKKNFTLAKKLYEKVIEIDPNIINAQFNLGIVYDELNENDRAIKCYKKVINLDPKFITAYNNIGLIFYKSGNNEKAIQYFKKAISKKSDYASAYNNLGLIYADLGKFKEAIKYYIFALEHNVENKSAIKNLILALTFYSPDNKHPIIDANNDLRKLSSNLDLDNMLQTENLILLFKKTYEIQNKIKKNLKFLEFTDSQAFRKNTTDLNCERHHDVFNKSNIIPNFCFGCFKIQIEPTNVVELIKLFLIFDNLKLPNNNWRKCMIELRSKISGVYKGLIYCRGIEEAEEILSDIIPILKKNLKYKVSIKRGCSEFYKSFPNFNILKKGQKNFMNYDNNWEKLEINSDLNKNYKKQKLVSSISGLSISDVLIINEWLNYASIIKDKSYDDIGLQFIHSEYIYSKMQNQIEFRKKQFLC